MYQQSTRTFESNKTLGGVGAILTAIGSFVPFAGAVGIVSLVGIILILISMKGLADDFQDGSIYRNALNGFIYGIIAIVITIVVAIIAFAAIFSFGAFSGFGIGVAALTILAAIAGLVILFIFFVLSAMHFRRAFDTLGEKSGERMFHTGGFLLFLGAILTIVIVGFILLFVAWILLAVAFFSMRPPMAAAPAYAPPYTQAPPPTTPPTGAQVKYCPYCGAENKIEATFCTHCGRRLT